MAGSIVAYGLRITTVNPLEHNIPFERFMNPDRPTPPDIDMDFADDRRDEVIHYVTEKYGKEKSCPNNYFWDNGSPAGD